MAKKKYIPKPVKVYKIGKWKDGEYRPERALLKTLAKAIEKLDFHKRWNPNDKVCILEYECVTPKPIIVNEGEVIPLTETSKFLYG